MTKALSLFLVFLSLMVYGQDSVRVQITINPDGVDAGQKVYIAGNLPILGFWDPAGLEMENSESAKWDAEFYVPIGKLIEFKIT